MILRYRSLRNWKYQTMALYIHDTPIYGHDCKTDWIRLNAEGQLVIQPGYCWDGASGLTWDSKCSMRGSLTHDALYQLMRLELLPQSCKAAADRLLRDICIEDGMWPIRAAIWCAGVKCLGGFSCEPGSEPEDKIYEVGR